MSVNGEQWGATFDVEEEMNKFNDLPKMLMDVHQGYNQLLDDDEKEKDDEWFD